MTRFYKILLGLSAVAAATPIYLDGYRDILVYALAIIPPVITAFVAKRTKEIEWAYLSVLIFWSAAILLILLSLLIWPTDAWAPIIWIWASMGWLVGAVLIAVIAELVRHFGKIREPNQASKSPAPSDAS